MYDRHAHIGYRNLTKNEEAFACRAIDWLIAKRVETRTIALMSERMLDREAKIINVTVVKGHLVFYRRIRYAGTAFDYYLTEVLPCLKVKTWVFPNLCWTGVKPSFGFHVHVEAVENYRQNHKKKVLIMPEGYCRIEVSASNTHIQKQIMVGRRIALRA